MFEASLFDAPSQLSVSSLTEALAGPLLYDLSASISVLGVAFLGFVMLDGRLNVRRSFRVALGCFVLLGAPAIASTFFSLLQVGESQPVTLSVNSTPLATPREALPPASQDPYAGASLVID